MKIVIVLAFLGILASLGSALFFMLRKPGDDAHDPSEPARNHRRSAHMARALTVRVLLSLALFACLLIGWKLGFIQPTGLR